MTPAEFRAARLAAGLSVRRAGETLGVAPSSVFRWETGRRGIPSTAADHIRKLAAERAAAKGE